MVEIKGKLKKIGGSFWLLIPKALIDCRIINQDQVYIFKIKEIAPVPEGKEEFELNPVLGLFYNLARGAAYV